MEVWVRQTSVFVSWARGCVIGCSCDWSELRVQAAELRLPEWLLHLWINWTTDDSQVYKLCLIQPCAETSASVICLLSSFFVTDSLSCLHIFRFQCAFCCKSNWVEQLLNYRLQVHAFITSLHGLFKIPPSTRYEGLSMSCFGPFPIHIDLPLMLNTTFTGCKLYTAQTHVIMTTIVPSLKH